MAAWTRSVYLPATQVEQAEIHTQWTKNKGYYLEKLQAPGIIAVTNYLECGS